MLMLRVTGYGAYGLAAVSLIMLSYGWVFLGAAISLAATGTAFLAADKIVQLLGEIRDRLPRTEGGNPEVAAAVPFEGPVRTAEQIDADLKRLRGSAI